MHGRDGNAGLYSLSGDARRSVPGLDPMRVANVPPLATTADAGCFAYTYARGQSELYLVKGIEGVEGAVLRAQ